MLNIIINYYINTLIYINFNIFYNLNKIFFNKIYIRNINFKKNFNTPILVKLQYLYNILVSIPINLFFNCKEKNINTYLNTTNKKYKNNIKNDDEEVDDDEVNNDGDNEYEDNDEDNTFFNNSSLKNIQIENSEYIDIYYNIIHNIKFKYNNFLLYEDIINQLLSYKLYYTIYHKIYINKFNNINIDKILYINKYIYIDIKKLIILLNFDNFLICDKIAIKKINNKIKIYYKNYFLNLKIIIKKFEIDITLITKENIILDTNENNLEYINYNTDNDNNYINDKSFQDFLKYIYIDKNEYNKLNDTMKYKIENIYKILNEKSSIHNDISIINNKIKNILQNIDNINIIINQDKNCIYIDYDLYDNTKNIIKNNIFKLENILNNNINNSLSYNKDEINKLLYELKEFYNNSQMNYYTKKELNCILDKKSDIYHNHDDKYLSINEKCNFVLKDTFSNIITNKSDINHNHDDKYLPINEKNNIIYFILHKINEINNKLRFSNNLEEKLRNYDDSTVLNMSSNIINLLNNYNIIDEYFKKLSNNEIPSYYNKNNIIYNNMLTFDKIFNLIYLIINKLNLDENNKNDYELSEYLKRFKNNSYYINYKNY